MGVVAIMLKVNMLDFSTNKKLILAEDAEKFYNHIFTLIKNGEEIVLDFAGIEYAVSSFYNASVCLLFKDFENADKLISVKNIDESDRLTYTRAMSNAKLFYKAPQNYINIDEV